jgi:hypothetical protein
MIFLRQEQMLSLIPGLRVYFLTVSPDQSDLRHLAQQIAAERQATLTPAERERIEHPLRSVRR